MPDPIAEWYAAKDREVEEAYEHLQEAKTRNAPYEELRKLQKAYEEAGYCGD